MDSHFDLGEKLLKDKQANDSQTGQKNRMLLTKLDALFREPEENIHWLVESILPSGGFSVLASKPKVGKSTLARNLALCVARGETFLNMAVTKGPVIYYALEEKRSEVKRHFRDMGASETDDIYIYTGSTPVDALHQIKNGITEIKPVLIIVDPLFRLAKVRDGNDYIQVTQALEPILHLAHILELRKMKFIAKYI